MRYDHRLLGLGQGAFAPPDKKVGSCVTNVP
jgi:hypothetical protein